MVAVAKIPVRMSVAEFLGWEPGDGNMWQLVDGEPQAMAPPNRTHAAIQGELGGLIHSHLLQKRSPCSVLVTPGVVPRIRSDYNFRIPDLAVACSDYQVEEAAVADPILIVEILSPSNQAETWANVWAYTTIPSVQEILVVHTEQVMAELLVRSADGSWPAQPLTVQAGDLALTSIGLTMRISALYRTSRLAAAR